jgi:hypothetical protein
MRTLKVLYIHATATFGGASKSLCEMLQSVTPGQIDATVLCPQGSAAERFRLAGVRVVADWGIPKWDHTPYGYYRPARWLVLLREFVCVPSFLLGLERLHKFLGQVDLVHANDITVLLDGMFATDRLRGKLVVHASSLQNDDTRLRRTHWQARLLDQGYCCG